MRRIKLLLVGLGGMGKVHLCNIEHLDNVDVVAVVGKGETDKSVAKSHNLDFFDSIKIM